MGLCSPKVAIATATVRNRLQPFATVRSDSVRLSLCANAIGVVSRISQGDLCPRRDVGVYRGSVCVSDLRRRIFLAFAEEVSV